MQEMSNLPESRIEPFEPPFTRVGVDFFGPLMVKRSSEVKRYDCIFIFCLAIRAVHNEVAYTLYTDSLSMRWRGLWPKEEGSPRIFGLTMAPILLGPSKN